MTSNNSTSLKPGKIQTIRPMPLVVLYSLGAVLLLGYLSFKWVYSHPSQVAIRIERSAEGAGVSSVKVLGAAQEAFAGVRADEVAIEAGEATLANLLGVHVGDVTIDCQGAGGVGTSTVGVQAGGIRGGTPVLVCSARAEVAERGGRWNLATAFDADRIRVSAAADPFEILVRELDLGLSLEGGWGRRVRLDDLELSGGGGGLQGRAVISKSADWDGGSFTIDSPESGEWTLSGYLQNVRNGENWRPLLPTAWAVLWDRLKLEGGLTLRIERFSRGSAGSEFSGSLQGAAVAFRLPVVGLPVTGMNGSAKLGNGSVSWGKIAGLDSPELVLLGQSGSLSGTVDGKGGSLQVALSEQAIVEGAAPGAPQTIRDLMAALRPTGRLSGLLDLSIASVAEDAGAWKLLLSLDALKFLGAPFIDPGKVLLQLEGKKEGGPGGLASGALTIEDLAIRGLVSLAGSIDLRWGGDGLALEASELAIRLAGAPEAEPRGILKGSLRTVSDGGGVEGDVDWLGVELRSGLLAAEEMSGQASIELATGVVLGESRLKKIRVPAGILGEKELVYEAGVAEWSIDEDGIHLSMLELSGSLGAVRVTGTIGLDSRIDLVCVRVGEKEAAALTALPLKSNPADWVAASEGAYGASRLSGKIDAPLVRPVYRDDKVLKQEERNDSGGN